MWICLISQPLLHLINFSVLYVIMVVRAEDAKEMAGAIGNGVSKVKTQLLGVGLLVFLLFWVIRVDKFTNT